MAENKKSVLLYCDLIHTVEKLDDATAGELFKHYLRYINDQNPTTDNILVEVVFEPIKQSLKRDLTKWESTLDKRSDAGKKSAAKKQFDKWLLEHPDVYFLSKDDHLFEAGRCDKYRKEGYDGDNTVEWYYYTYCIEFHQQMATKSTSVESVEQGSTKSTDSVSVSVNDNVSVIDKDISFLEKKPEKIYYRKFDHLKITYEDFEKLKKDFTETEINEVLDRIENYKKNTSYKSLYLTANTWLKKAKKNETDGKPNLYPIKRAATYDRDEAIASMQQQYNPSD